MCVCVCALALTVATMQKWRVPRKATPAQTFEGGRLQLFCTDGSQWRIVAFSSLAVAGSLVLEEVEEDWRQLQCEVDDELQRCHPLESLSEHQLLALYIRLWARQAEVHVHSNANRVPPDMHLLKSSPFDGLLCDMLITGGKGRWKEWLSRANDEDLSLAEDPLSRNLLHYAAAARRADVLEWILAKCSHPDLVSEKDTYGFTPLHLAAYVSDLRCCEVLIQRGDAAVMPLALDESFPLHYLVRNRYTENSDVASFRRVLVEMVARGLGIDAQDNNGNTALHLCALYGSCAMMRCLLEEDAQPNIRNSNGETAIHLAAAGCQNKAVRLLLAYGAFVDVLSTNGTPLAVAKKWYSASAAVAIAQHKSTKGIPASPDANQIRRLRLQPGDRYAKAVVTSWEDVEEGLAAEISASSNGEERQRRLLQVQEMGKPPAQARVLVETSLPLSSYLSDDYCPRRGTRTDNSSAEVRERRGSITYGLMGAHRGKERSEDDCDFDEEGNLDGRLDYSAARPRRASVTGDADEARLSIRPELHRFIAMTFHKPSRCGHCDGFMWLTTGYQCSGCDLTVHKGDCRRDALFSTPCSFASSPRDLEATNPSAGDFHEIETSTPTPGLSGGLLSNPGAPSNVPLIRFVEEGTADVLHAASKGVSQLHETVADILQLRDTSVSEEMKVLLIRFGAYCTEEELRTLYEQFLRVDKANSGVIRLEELTAALGPFMGAERGVASLLMDTFLSAERHRGDNDSKEVGFEAFAGAMCILLSGSAEERLRFAFSVFNYRAQGKGTLSLSDVKAAVSPCHAVMQAAEIQPRLSSDDFASQLFHLLRDCKVNAITRESFLRKAPRHLLFIQSLGEIDNKTAELRAQAHSDFTSGITVSVGHERWDLVVHVLLGMRRALLAQRNAEETDTNSTPGAHAATANGVLERKRGRTMSHLRSHSDTGKDLTQREFRFSYEANKAFSWQKCSWTFVDYGSDSFSSLRNILSIDAESYAYSVGVERVLGNLLVGNMSALTEVTSTGRSGSFFLRTNDSRFLLKTLPESEFALFRRMLPEYVEHMRRYPNSLLPRFTGMHSIRKDRGPQAGEFNFVVMCNLFDGQYKVHEQYDLKGSTVNRHVDTISPDVARKDNDFCRTLCVSKEHLARILEQVENDCKLLERWNLCDYSLLVGIHFLSPDSEVPLSFTYGQDPSIFKHDFGGLVSGDEKELYFLGIIDTLTEWDMQKRSERAIKSLLNFSERTGVSAMSPLPYRLRFQKYVASLLTAV